MKFSLVRIDDRLIHGQVALGWTRSKGIECIIAVDDETSNDSFRVSLLKMATPTGVKSFIVDKDSAIEKINSGAFENKKTMLLVKKTETLLYLIKNGIAVEEVNVGNLRNEEGDKLLSYVYVSKEEIADFKEMRNQKVSFYAQALPDQQMTDFNSIIDKI